MANLRDIRTRINSVKTTRQVTNAMKMVSAARLKKAQRDITHIRPYSQKMAQMMSRLSASLEENVSLDYTQVPADAKDHTLIIAIASNRGLCGGFNSNVVKTIQNLLNGDLYRDHINGKVKLAVLGRQIEKQFKSRKITLNEEYHDLLQSISFSEVSDFSAELMRRFNEGEFSKVILVYNEFVNAAVQNVQVYQYLPFHPIAAEDIEPADYIFEPDAKSIIQIMIPTMLQVMLFRVLLESQASEHGARMTSMHKATDNATDLIRDLQLGYNKARQTAITNQIVEITGGAEALNNK